MHVVIEHHGRAHDVEVVLDDPCATVADLLAALEPPAPSDAVVTIDGHRVPRHRPLGDSLREGAVVRIGAGGAAVAARSASTTTPADGLVVAVVDGPAAGASAAPSGARLRIGRAGDADLVIADPAVSARHAELRRLPDGGVEVVDLGSRNGTVLDGRPVLGRARVPPGALLELGATRLRLRPQRSDDRPAALPLGPGGRVAFNRPPRPGLPPRPAPLPLPTPPARSTVRRTLSLVSVLAPLAIGAVLVVVYDNPLFALFLLLSPLLAIGTWASARREARQQDRAGSRAFRRDLRALARGLAAAAAAERRRRAAVLPDLAEVARRVRTPSAALWQRRAGHDDFLQLRVGSGTVTRPPPLEDSRDPPVAAVQRLVRRAARLPRCPVGVDLADGGVVGLVGDRGVALALARSLLLQACVHHGPADLAVMVLTSREHVDAWDWAKWLPHTADHGGGQRLLAGDPDTADALASAVLAAVPAPSPAAREPPRGPTLLCVLDDVTLLRRRRAPVRRLLDGEAGPVAGIVLADSVDQLPAVTRTVIALDDDLGRARLHDPHGDGRVDDLVVGGLPEAVARDLARCLARYDDPDLAVAGAALPARVRLLPLLGAAARDPEPLHAEPLDAAAVARTWAAARPAPPLRTPLGVAEDGVVEVDLVADGPHVLVGGTTGAGKSELLRALVAGLAARVDPDHVVFLLVDYKGGSAFDACARLPHTLGVVTDLDAFLGERALRSLRAEVRHREQVLRRAGVADLPAYLAAGAPLGPLPRLVVVVDEFAALAAELPDFLGALVGVAQRGRSLGVHLVLATQRPHGVVSADITANTDLRIALRVQDPRDSSDVIGVPDAARIPRTTPGRAYLRRGPGEVTLLQTALASGTAPATAQPLTLRDFSFGPAPPAAAAVAGDGPGDLDALVDACAGAWAASGRPPPRPVWLPMLPEHLAWDDLVAAADDVPAATAAGDELADGTAADDVVFALADDPDRQRRRAVGWRPRDGDLGLFGTSDSGAGDALRAVVRALVETHTPDDCHVYAVDVGAGRLADLAALPHVGAVIAATEGERQRRLLRWLRREVARRRQLGAAAAAEPLVVVAVDGLPAFLAELDDGDGEAGEALRRLLVEGPAVGVVFAVTGDRLGGLPLRVSGALRRTYAFRHADPADLASVGLRPAERPRFCTGRAVDTDSARVVQVADPGPVSSWAARHGTGGRRPTTIGVLPATVDLADLPPEPVLRPPPVRLPLGIVDDDLGCATLLLHPGEHALVAGPARSGVTSALRLLAAQARRADPEAVLVAVCSPRSALYGDAPFDAAGSVGDLAAVLRAASRDVRPWLVVVDDAPLVDDADGLLSALLREGRDGLHVVAGGRSDDLRGAFASWTRLVRQARTGLLLQPDPVADGELLGVRLPRRLPVALGPGRGFLVTAGSARLVQVARPPAVDNRDAAATARRTVDPTPPPDRPEVHP